MTWTWLVLSPLPYVLVAAAMLGLVWWSHHRGYIDGTDDMWDVVRGALPDLPDTLEELLAQAQWHPFHVDADVDLFDEGCSAGDPDCLSRDDECHDACVTPSCRYCGSRCVGCAPVAVHE